MREPVAFGCLAMAALALQACSRDAAPVPRGGSLEVEWVGTDTGKLTAPAVAEWCDSLQVLELRAMHGDTGIALALYPTDSMAPGEYRVVAPERGDSVRPAAAVALRWFAETSIRGFRSDSGSVSLTATGPGAGRFGARLRSVEEGDRLRVTGSFTGLTVTDASPECAGVEPDPDDTMPDVAEEFRETAD
ncbi:MAG TPA: hypothetical protein VHG35_18575 [Gemmatimonadales bacterium]|nr:hypothetical protein [Gemmatimonadales bacterium]